MMWKTLHGFMSQEVLDSSSFSTTSQYVALAKLLHFSTQFVHQLDMDNWKVCKENRDCVKIESFSLSFHFRWAPIDYAVSLVLF